MKGEVYKNYYPILDVIKEEITRKESNKSIIAYEQHLQKCMRENICSECGEPVIVDETWTKDERREYCISAVCKECQLKIFGV